MQTTRLRDFEVWYENGEEFHQIKRDVFGDNQYWVELESDVPYIVDVGAHIGLTTLYFKLLYPKSEILAIEANPANTVLLERNIEVNRLGGVIVLQTAVGGGEGQRTFHVDETNEQWYSTGSFYPHAWNNQQETKIISVKQQRLSKLIDKDVDLLKLDIEGAEEEVLFEIEPVLRRISTILFEFHPVFGRNPEKVERYLKRKGYEVTFTQKGKEVDWRKTRGLLMGEAVANRK